MDDTDPIISGEINLEGLAYRTTYLRIRWQYSFSNTYVEDIDVSDNLNAIGDNAMLIREIWMLQLIIMLFLQIQLLLLDLNHVMVLTNNGVGIRIYDKQGTLLKSINSTTWWSAVWPSQSGDPQIFYDHFANRWVMLFMQVDDVAFNSRKFNCIFR